MLSQVILKLSEQVAACMTDPRRTMSTTNGLEALTFHQLQEDTENLKVGLWLVGSRSVQHQRWNQD
jgi:hypothetical protein